MNEPVPHYVNKDPFDPYSTEMLTPEQERFYMASQWKMIWWRLKSHRLAVISGIILIAMYVAILFAEFLAPYNLHSRNTDFIYAPPQRVHLFHEGSFEGPFVYGLDYHLNMLNLKREYTENPDKIDHLRFFCFGDSYSFWGLIDGSFHLLCPSRDGTMFLFGTDRLGRDMFSRIIYGSRISLTVGLIGIAFSFMLGISIGGAAGYFGG
ncbi:MAG: ABC transporter permease, partial [Gammaproteobacteria bacterium]|nr:ABC transporter permease [Gammaproteobacteria bacterium]